MFTRELEQRKKSLKLNSIQEQVLVGILLGDGHLESKNRGMTYRLKIEHTEQQKAYVDWLHSHFIEWVAMPPRSKTRRADFQRKSGEYNLYGFQTLSAGSLRFFAHQFYDGAKKAVPTRVGRWLTPLALAVWYMDDGSIKSKDHRTFILNTQGFTGKDLEVLQKALIERFGVKTTFRKQKEGTQLQVSNESNEVFVRLILPHILPSMRYKIPHQWLTQLPKR